MREHCAIRRQNPAALDPQLLDKGAVVERVVTQRLRVDHGPPGGPQDQRHEQDHEQEEQKGNSVQPAKLDIRRTKEHDGQGREEKQ